MEEVIHKLQIALFALAGSVLFTTCQIAQCQEPGPPLPGPTETAPSINVDKQLTKMVKRYGLSEIQKRQIRPILLGEKEKIDELFRNSSLSPEERFDSMRTIHDDEVSRISAILNDDQKKKYLKDQKHMIRPDDSWPDGLPPDAPPPGGPPDGL